MLFFTKTELASNTDDLLKALAQEGEITITDNGTPSALMIHIPEGKLDETLRMVRQARTMMVLNALRMQAAKQGYFSEDEIEEEIAAIRKLCGKTLKRHST